MTRDRRAKAARREETGKARPAFYDFFAGIGMVRLGLEPEWRCVWANDIDPRKRRIYAANFRDADEVFRLGDIAEARGADLPGRADLAWACFPCQDLSQAGPRAGIRGPRSAAFWEFVRVMRELAAEGRRPPLVVLENVAALLRPESLEPVCKALADLGLRPGALLIDARRFLPQSRPRAFVIAAEPGLAEAAAALGLAGDGPDPLSPWSPPRLLRAFQGLPRGLRERWVWWRLPAPEKPPPPLAALLDLEEAPEDAPWDPPEKTRRLLEMMAPRHRLWLAAARRTGGRVVATAYRRMRDGTQRVEIRTDGLAGCLRASRGGSSRLILVVVEGKRVRSRRLSVREAARLMGVPDRFRLPSGYGDAYAALGDGVAVPVVRWLSRRLLLPLVRAGREGGRP